MIRYDNTPFYQGRLMAYIWWRSAHTYAILGQEFDSYCLKADGNPHIKDHESTLHSNNKMMQEL